MRLRAFRGGVHPPEEKRTAGRAVETLPPPPVVWLPLAQHLGAPAKPCVKTGDSVKVGDVVAEAAGFVSTPVHASIAGKVKAIEPAWHPSGRRMDAVRIEAEGPDEWHMLPPIADPLAAERAALLERVRASGLVGLGGATFPTHVKLAPPEGKAIDTILINGVECEPYLTADHRLMLEDPEPILDGARIFARILGARRIVVAIEANKPDAIARMKRLADGTIEIVRLAVRYPQGAEKQLIHAILGRDVPSGGLPMDVGALVQNVGTAHAASRAVREGRPLVERIVTVTGPGVAEPKNLRVRLGTPIRALIEACGGLAGEPGKIIMGGPMMGLALHSLDAPVVKGTSGLLVLPRQAVREVPRRTCLRCGECVRNCPMGLEPTLIAHLAERKRFDECEALRALDCIECGCCSYGCPSGIPLVQLIRYAKAEILDLRRRRAAETEREGEKKWSAARKDT